MDNTLRDELLAMEEEDGRVRGELVATGELFGGYHPRMRAVQEEHADRLEEIIDAVGWPGTSLVGEEGETAAWRVLVHAISRPGLMRRCRALLREAVDAGEAPARQLAYLEDRIRFFEQRPQRYGTHFDWDADGEMSPVPIEEPETVDDRRDAVGLPPLAQQTDRIRARAAEEGDAPPADIEAWREEQRAFARDVGWIE